MEEPGPPMNELLMKMIQLFPEFPLQVIHFYVSNYGQDPHLCQRMLEHQRLCLLSSPSSNMNTKQSDFLESAVTQRTKWSDTANKETSLNQNQELKNYMFQLLPNVPVNVSTEMSSKRDRNLSYAGMSTSPPQIVIPNPVHTAPVTTLDFNNAFQVFPNYLQCLGQPASISQNGSSNIAYISTSGDTTGVSYPSVQTFRSSDIPNHTSDRSKCVQENPTTSSPSNVTYDTQLSINVDPFYSYGHYQKCDQRSTSPYSNVQIPSPLGQQIVMQQGSGFAHGPLTIHTNSPPFMRNDLYGADELRPQLMISPRYGNKNLGSSLQNVHPEEQSLHVGQILMRPASNSSAIYLSHYVQDHVHQQKSDLHALKCEILQSHHTVDLCNAEILKLEQKLRYKIYLPDKKMVQDMKDEISKLRVNCHYLCMEVDLQLKGQAPLGMVDEDFYKTIFTGQHGSLLPPTEQASASSSPSSTVDLKQVSVEEEENKESSTWVSIEEEEENKESNTWECNRCTFANHPAINVCEMCHIPRSILPGMDSPPKVPSLLQNATCYCHGISESDSLLKLDTSDAA